jgi:threonine synthase
LESFPAFNFDRDVLPEEFRGLLQKERRVIDVDAADVDLVKNVIESKVDTERVGSSTLSV